MNGGGPAARGLNLLSRYNDKYNHSINLGSKNTVSVSNGDRLAIYSPGGGGYGAPRKDDGSVNSSVGIGAKIMNVVSSLLGTNTESTSMARASGSLNQYTLNQESV
jgi:N-methylhydantoinase B/oxoprolinase/acetone carboxylase alpha subunit